MSNLNGASPSGENRVEERKDFTLLDELILFLDKREVLPILCGYFAKVVLALLNKTREKFLEYILIHKEGIIFNKLLNHLEHHSIA